MRSRPDLSLKEMALRLKRSYAWAKKWAKRLATAPADDAEILHSRSRARQTPHAEWNPLVVRRSEHFRQAPPRASSGPLAQRLFSPTSRVMSTSNVLRVLFLVPLAPSGKSSNAWG